MPLMSVACSFYDVIFNIEYVTFICNDAVLWGVNWNTACAEAAGRVSDERCECVTSAAVGVQPGSWRAESGGAATEGMGDREGLLR